jgi:uncharacterized protein (DUF58 family)
MNPWLVTGSLSRAAAVSAFGLSLALIFGNPVFVVLVAPFLPLTALGLVLMPRSTPRITSRLDHGYLHEGQGTRFHLVVDDLTGAEHVTRVAVPVPYVAMHPSHGRLGGLVARADDLPVVEVSPRRWGRRVLGEEQVALTSPWSGFRFGPVRLAGTQMSVLPQTAPYDSRAEAPQPIGLVGAHRSRRVGSGSEFAGIRGFQTGDRLRRINWRVSLRTGSLHVVTSRAEEDSGVLLVVDALADHGRSRGVGGVASSMDVTVRATAAIAEHHAHTGDRVALRVVGPFGENVGYGAGRRHLRMLLGRLATLQVGHLRPDAELTFGATAGTVVMVMSPMLSHEMGTATATLVKRGLPVMVIDTLPEDAAPAVIEGTDPDVAELAWRMRKVEREEVLARLAALGCPVVAWRGPGTLDDVMRRLARRAQLPTVRVR